MAAVLEYKEGDSTIQIVVDDDGGGRSTGASQKASTGGLFSSPLKAKLSLEDAADVVGQLASAFSGTLAKAASKPSTVDIEFGLEASGELGNFLVSKVSAKTNFTVKMAWKFD
jgi:hypothetical protein